jgi:hypothetical protein
LVVGCGNSTFSEDLFHDKYLPISNITSVDISPVVINRMRKRTSGIKPRDGFVLRWQVADCLDLADALEKGSTTHSQPQSGENDIPVGVSITQPGPNFSVVVDKGCLDTFLFRNKTKGTKSAQIVGRYLQQVNNITYFFSHYGLIRCRYSGSWPRTRSLLSYPHVKEYQVTRTPSVLCCWLYNNIKGQ